MERVAKDKQQKRYIFGCYVNFSTSLFNTCLIYPSFLIAGQPVKGGDLNPQSYIKKILDYMSVSFNPLWFDSIGAK